MYSFSPNHGSVENDRTTILLKGPIAFFTEPCVWEEIAIWSLLKLIGLERNFQQQEIGGSVHQTFRMNQIATTRSRMKTRLIIVKVVVSNIWVLVFSS